MIVGQNNRLGILEKSIFKLSFRSFQSELLELCGPAGRLAPPVSERAHTASLPAPKAREQPAAQERFLAAQPVAERDVYRLDEAFHRMAAGDIDGDRENELVLLNNEELQAFRLQWGRLQPVAGYRLPSVDMVGLHIDATDVNGDGRAEILVSLLKDSTSDQTDTRLASMILTFDGTAFQVLARDLPFYLKVMEDRCGEPVLLGQKKGKHEPFEGEIVVFLWDARKGGFDHSSEYQPAHNVHSLHQFNLIPSDDQRIAILEPDGTLNVYCTPSEKVESSVGRNYGELKEIPFRIQLPGERYPGGFTRQTFGTSFVPVRFEYKESFDDQMFLIDKGRTGGSGLVRLAGLGSTRKGEDSIVAVKWSGKTLLETWRDLRPLARTSRILPSTFTAEGRSSWP